MSKCFIPKLFKFKGEHEFIFGTMSKVYWDLAEEFYSFASQEFEKDVLYSKYVLPSIIFYCSCVEANINEQLAVYEGNLKDSKVIQVVAELKNNGIKKKISPTFEIFSQESERNKVVEKTLYDFYALTELRNAFVHFKPDWDSNIYKWPKRIKDAFQKSKIDPFDPDWTVNFRSKEIIEWARGNTKSILIEFFKVTNQDEKEFFKEK